VFALNKQQTTDEKRGLVRTVVVVKRATAESKRNQGLITNNYNTINKGRMSRIADWNKHQQAQPDEQTNLRVRDDDDKTNRKNERITDEQAEAHLQELLAVQCIDGKSKTRRALTQQAMLLLQSNGQQGGNPIRQGNRVSQRKWTKLLFDQRQGYTRQEQRATESISMPLAQCRATHNRGSETYRDHSLCECDPTSNRIALWWWGLVQRRS
jgi:hypothetical protein